MRRPLFVALIALALAAGAAAAQTDPTPTEPPTATPTEEPTDVPPVGGVLGWDVTQCAYRSTSRTDPIVMPDGVASSHFHDLFGAKINRYSAYDSVRLANANGCPRFAEDESGYWIPKLWDRTGAQMVPRSLNAYYRVAPGVDPQTVQPWAQGTELIAGYPGVVAPEPAPTHPNRPLALWFCGGAGNGREGDAPLPHDCLNPAYPYVVVNVLFPDCANGQPTSVGARDHFAFSAGGACPATHPIHVPQLSEQIAYNSALGTGAYLDSNLAYRDTDPATAPNAYGMHADWLDGWSQPEVAFLIDRCIKSGTGCGNKRPSAATPTPTATSTPTSTPKPTATATVVVATTTATPIGSAARERG